MGIMLTVAILFALLVALVLTVDAMAMAWIEGVSRTRSKDWARSRPLSGGAEITFHQRPGFTSAALNCGGRAIARSDRSICAMAQRGATPGGRWLREAVRGPRRARKPPGCGRVDDGRRPRP